VAPVTKLLPLTVKVNAGPPRTTVDGLSEVIAGGGYCTATAMLFELPPPGPGVTTVIGTLATGAERSEARIETVSCVLLTYVVERFAPFHCTTEFVTKLLPVTVKEVAALPTVSELGETPPTIGAAGGEIVKLEEA
jgi:hypothetical protein